jgi:two-component system nitrogen regulation response regulator GlnG/two-component system response regulator HydG
LDETLSTNNFELPWRRTTSGPAPDSPHLVIAWSLEEPHRIGEVASVPKHGGILGRGGDAPDDAPFERLSFARHRPAQIEPTSPIQGARVSRHQLLLMPVESGELDVESLGRCPLSVNGVPVSKARVKPGDILTLRNALILLVAPRSASRLAPGARSARTFPFGQADEHGIVGESVAAWELRNALAFTAASNEHVLLLGESGAGKELAACALHALSGRAGAMTSRNAATLPDSLVDAELFGNAKNYPNPGMPERRGLIGEANGSSLFLDEIGELSQTMQAHLLRVLDRGGEYQRLGDSGRSFSDFRLIAATNRDPSTLKHDFLARLPARVKLPGLNERREDIPLLVRHLLYRLCRSAGPHLTDRFFERRAGDHAEPRVDPDLIELFLRHRYTTHARELERLLWLALSTSPDDFVCATPELRQELGASAPEPEIEVDQGAVQAALAASGGNITRATRLLGLRNRYVLYRLMRKFGIPTRE